MESMKFYLDDAEGGGLVEADGYEAYVSAEDLDRLSAEREALKQRLTAQDQREDDLKVLLRKWDAYFGHLGGIASSLRSETIIALNPTAEAVSHDQ